MEVKVLKYEPVDKGVVIGYVDISLGKQELIIRRIAHLRKEGKEWFNFPQFALPGEGPRPAYVRYIEFNGRRDNEHLFGAIKAAIESQKVNPEPAPTPPPVEAEWQPEMF
jgi:hypothetical protein